MRPLLTSIPVLFCFTLCLAQQNVNFTADHLGGCSPLIVHFTAIGSGSMSWDLGNGNNSTIANPTAIYTTPGVYTITLTAGGGGIATHTVTVYAPPTASLTAATPKVCGTPVTYTGASTSPISSWLWDFGDGSTTTTYNSSVSHQYTQPGTVGASLTVTDNNGCTASVTQPALAQVLPALNAVFSEDKSVLCNVTDPVQFTNSSNGPGSLSYAWDFGDGTTSTATSPGHSYTAKGSYNVRLTVTSDQGCTATFSLPSALNVANYTTDFAAPTGSVCTGSAFAFNNNSNPAPTTSVWSVDGTPANYYSPFYYSFPTAGTHTITLANVFGTCPQSASKTVTVNQTPPSTPFTIATTNTCAGFSATFTDNSTGTVNRAWDFNYNYYAPNFVNGTGASISHPGYQYNTYYSVALQVTTPQGCSTIISQGLFVANQAPAIYEPNVAPLGSCNQPVTKTYAITYAGTLQSFSWDFGDGTTSTSPTPTHTWTAPGNYYIVLHYVDANGCSGVTNQLQTEIDVPLTMDFSGSPTTVCQGTTVYFTPILKSGTPANSIFWNYGDGNSGYNGFDQYNASGQYTVTMNATSPGGCQTSVTKTNYITATPGPGQFNSHSSDCVNRGLVNFAYTGAAASTTVTWTFGDGTTGTSSGTNPAISHTYTQTGTYNVSLSATNGTCTQQNSDVVHVLLKQNPVLSASTATVCATGSLNVNLAIPRNPWNIYSDYYYDYSPQFYYADGTPFTGLVSFSDYYQPYNNNAFGWTLTGFKPGETGLYVVTTAFGSNCTDQSNVMPLTVKTGATPAFTVITDDRCYQSPVVLKDASTAGANNSIVSGTWNFGDGQTQALVLGGTVNHTYSDPGLYNVQLSIQDAGGCQLTTAVGTGAVSANGPKAAFSSSGSPVLLGNTLYLYNYTNYYGTTSVSYNWTFGDGSSSTDYSPTHLYSTPGTYTVTLTASDAAGGCSSVATATIVVQNFNSHFQTYASYVTGGKCPPVLAQFYNTSAGYSSVSWDFGDGSTVGNVNNPGHVYQTPGRYIVTLSIYGVGGLVAQYIDSVIVRYPSGSVSAAATSLCMGQPAQFQATARGAMNFLFDFGDGNVGSGTDSAASHLYQQPGSYAAQLVVVDTFGCAAAGGAAVNITVHPPPTVTVSPTAPVACLNSSVPLTASGGITYSWSPATGLDQANVPSPVASPLTTTTYSVLATDANGCQGSGTVTVKVQPPEKIAVSPDSTSVCTGNTIGIKATGTDLYSWIGTVDGLSSLTAGSVTATSDASMTGSTLHYIVVGSDTYSCFTDTAIVAMTVLPVPTVDAGPDVEVLAGTPVPLLGTGSSDVVNWRWTPPDYLSCTDCAQPVSTPKKPEIYTATVTNGVGCTASDTVSVKLICEQTKVRIPDAFTPNGDGHNDKFTIQGIGEVDHVVVYDRWGALVFEANHVYTADADAQWDGRAHGQPAPTGVYVYYVQMTCPTGGTFGKKGTVVLIR